MLPHETATRGTSGDGARWVQAELEKVVEMWMYAQ